MADGLWPTKVAQTLLSFEEKKFAQCDLHLCLFCKNREEKIDLEASRCWFYRKVG